MPLRNRTARAALTATVSALVAPVLLAVAVATPAQAAVAPERQETARELVQEAGVRYGAAILDRLVDRQRPGTSLALWANPTGSCRRCQGGPGLAAAAIAARTGERKYLDVARRTFDDTIARGWDARSGGMRAAAGGAPNDIETAFFAGSLGTATVLLGDKLDAAHRARWTKVVVGAAGFLHRNGNFTYYTNGNIALANAVVAQSAFRLTNAKAWSARYDTAMRTALHPGRRFPGRGLVLTRKPTKADWSDAAGYLTEENPGKPGYDPEYTLLQTDMLLQLDILGGGRAPRRLLNASVNQVWPKVNRSAWTVDLSRGSRHQESGRIHGFTSAAPAYLALRGRTDLLPVAAANAAAAGRDLAKNAGTYQPAARFTYGATFAALTR